MKNSLLKGFFKKFVVLIETNLSVSVGTKILVPFFLIILIVVDALSFFVTGKIREKIEEMEIRRAVTILETTVQGFEKERETVVTYANIFGDSGDIAQAFQEGDTKRLYEILIASKEYSKQQKIILFDRFGRVVVQAANSPTIHQDAKQLMKKGRAGLTTSTLTVSENGLEIYAVTPLMSDMSSATDYPVLLLDRHIGEKELNAIKKREGVEITIISNRKVVASTLETSSTSLVLKDISGSTGSNVVPSRIVANNVEYINVWQPIGSQGLISVMVPNSDLLAVKQSISGDILRTTVFAMILVFVCATVLAELIVRPLRGMLATTKAITGGDFSQKIEVLTKDEFGQLGQGINYMAERIKERLDYAEHLATVDGLTGLYNHRYFQQRLIKEIERAIRTGSKLSLIMMDIDYFKNYNDKLGHPAGDKLLQELAKILLSCVRTVDVVARYGGEEFAVILVDTCSLDACEVGERIRVTVEGYEFAGRENQPNGKVTMSLGIAAYPENAYSKDDLIKLADDALYKAKHLNRNKVVLYYSVLDELKSGIDESEHDLLNTVKTLISVVNSRDRYTYGHSDRVVQYATSIAKEMNISGKELRDIKVAAFLHDIGKIEIGREILNKTGSLTADEFDIIKQHPSWGAQIVSSIDSLKDIVPMILFHHEKYDGTGYPQGLSGQDIPWAARILKLADSFDAMTSHRPYQIAKTMEQAKEEIMFCKEKDFDPELVDVFLRILDSQGKC